MVNVVRDLCNADLCNAFTPQINGHLCLQAYWSSYLIWIISLCVSLAVCLSKITASENEPSVFSLIQRVYSYYVSVFILLCVCD